ncbi:MAG: WecB/TagA/CpsF family glycosyltransferase [Muribaculaceae bacterium]|nr:WecB/TagA/CpsF family glycosyltransferase [Muribaculaceae bacterium]
MNRIELNGRKVNIFASPEELLDYISDKRDILVAVNAEKIINRDDRLKEIINANTGYLDGIGPVWAIRRKGFPEACKIPGCELWLKIVERFRNTRTFYLLGSDKDVVRATARRLQKDFPNICIAGYHDGFVTTDEIKSDVINEIASRKPDIVFVAMGSPKQELFMSELYQHHPALYMGLGGSFDIYTGKVKRAPKWWIANNLEFAYRLLKQPERIRRQIHLLRFVWMLVRNKL